MSNRICVVCGFLVGVLVLVGPPAGAVAGDGDAGTATAVLAQMLEATGGAQAWQEMQSLRITGEMGVAGELERVPFIIEWRRPMGIRFELELRTGATVQAFDGTTGWAVMPGAGDPVRLSQVQVRQLVQQTDPVGPLLRLAMRRSQPDQADPNDQTDPADQAEEGEQVEDVELGTLQLVKIRFEDELGEPVECLVDKGSGLELQRDWTGLVRGQPSPMRSIFRRYRQVGPLVLAHSVEVVNRATARVNVIDVERIELDPDLSDERFAMPGPAAESGPDADETAGEPEAAPSAG